VGLSKRYFQKKNCVRNDRFQSSNYLFIITYPRCGWAGEGNSFFVRLLFLSSHSCGMVRFYRWATASSEASILDIRISAARSSKTILLCSRGGGRVSVSRVWVRVRTWTKILSTVSQQTFGCRLRCSVASGGHCVTPKLECWFCSWTDRNSCQKVKDCWSTLKIFRQKSKIFLPVRHGLFTTLRYTVLILSFLRRVEKFPGTPMESTAHGFSSSRLNCRRQPTERN
jgi:hypothetical protein